MANIFDYNEKAFKEFSRFYAAAPGKARRATSRLLSQFAYGTREEATKHIKNTMTVRNPKFVETSIRWRGARPTNIDNQKSQTFSVSLRNTTGFKEQQDNKVDKRTRSQSLLARGNTFSKKVKPSLRMKPSRSFFSAADFDLPSGKAQTPALIKHMKKKYKNKPFLIKKKYRQIKRGLYKFVRNKMMLLQNFEKKPRPVKYNPWMDKARQNFFRSTNVDKEWGKAIKFITTKRKF